MRLKYSYFGRTIEKFLHPKIFNILRVGYVSFVFIFNWVLDIAFASFAINIFENLWYVMSLRFNGENKVFLTSKWLAFWGLGLLLNSLFVSFLVVLITEDGCLAENALPNFWIEYLEYKSFLLLLIHNWQNRGVRNF